MRAVSKPCVRHREPCGSCKFPGVRLTENGGTACWGPAPPRGLVDGGCCTPAAAPADGSKGRVSLVTPGRGHLRRLFERHLTGVLAPGSSKITPESGQGSPASLSPRCGLALQNEGPLPRERLPGAGVMRRPALSGGACAQLGWRRPGNMDPKSEVCYEDTGPSAWHLGEGTSEQQPCSLPGGYRCWALRRHLPELTGSSRHLTEQMLVSPPSQCRRPGLER